MAAPPPPGRHAAVRPQGLIAHLFGGQTHRLAIEVFRRHRDAGNGLCACCGNPLPCAPSTNAAAVLQAAGGDPDAVPAVQQREAGTHNRRTPPLQPGEPHFDDQGFYISGRRRSMNAAGYGYERDQ